MRELARQNKPEGFACVSCAWPKPADHHPAEFCEEGAKATAWELTSLRTTPAFFDEHTLSELRSWRDYDLEQHGRLDASAALRSRHRQICRLFVGTRRSRRSASNSARSIPNRWSSIRPGRTSLEASYMYGLMARMYGNQNLPDSSNMCHESTSVGLKAAIGVPGRHDPD